MVDDDLRPIKTGQTHAYVSVCADDATPSIQQLREGVWLMSMHIPPKFVLFLVVVLLGVRLVNICQGNKFVSNVTRKGYNVVSCDATMNCATENVVYLITKYGST